MSCPCNKNTMLEGLVEQYKQAAEVRQAEIERLEEENRELRQRVELMEEFAQQHQAELEEARATCNGAREYIQQLEAAKGPAPVGRVTVTINKTVTTRAILTDVPVEELSRLDGEILEINHMPGSCYCSEHRRVHRGSCPECKCPGCDLTNKECDEAGGCIPY